MRRISVALAVLLVAAACTGSSGDVTSTTGTTAAGGGPGTADYTSADGRLSLHVAGPVAGDVTIDEVDPASVDFGDDVETLGAYDLGPSGTSFDQPVEMTFDTGEVYDPDHPAPVASVLVTDDDQTWEALSPVSISVVDGSVVISAEVPHFSRLVINRGDYGMYIDPGWVDTWVGDVWEVYFDLFDRTFAPITNLPVRDRFLFRDGFDALANAFGGGKVGPVKTLSEDVTPIADTLFSGVVEPVEGNDWLGTYDYRPQAGYDGSLADSMSYVEIIDGYHDFGCAAEGRGTYGVSLDLVVHRGDLVFGARFANGQLALVQPSDGVVLHYEIEADAICRASYGRLAALVSAYFGVRTPLIDTLVGRVAMDSMGKLIYSISTVLAGVYSPKVDLWDSVGTRLRTSQFKADFIYNFSVFECGTTADVPRLGTDVTTVCPPGVGDVPEGDLIVIAAQYSDTLPTAGDENHYTYAAVFESNDDPSDDWQYQGPYDWDFFIGTDRWYQINWDPDSQQWSMTVTNGQKPGGETAARAVLAGDTIFWMIPASEFASPNPTYRVTSFIHDGTYAPEASGGDVSGDDPTEPLLPIYPVEG